MMPIKFSEFAYIQKYCVKKQGCHVQIETILHCNRKYFLWKKKLEKQKIWYLKGWIWQGASADVTDEANGEIGDLILKVEQLEKEKQELETSIAGKVQDRMQVVDNVRVSFVRTLS